MLGRVTFEPADQISNIDEGLGELDGLGRGFESVEKMCSKGLCSRGAYSKGLLNVCFFNSINNPPNPPNPPQSPRHRVSC